jgi:hypothetical protein
MLTILGLTLAAVLLLTLLGGVFYALASDTIPAWQLFSLCELCRLLGELLCVVLAALVQAIGESTR